MLHSSILLNHFKTPEAIQRTEAIRGVEAFRSSETIRRVKTTGRAETIRRTEATGRAEAIRRTEIIQIVEALRSPETIRSASIETRSSNSVRNKVVNNFLRTYSSSERRFNPNL